MMPYTKRSARYYDLMLHDEVGQAPAEVRFFRSLWGREVSRVLDVCCGTGRLAIPLARHYDVVGIDNSAEMLAMAKPKRRGSNPSFVLADARTYALQGRFDAAVCGSNTIGHFATEKDALALFANVRQALRPGGTFIFDMWDIEKWKGGYASCKAYSVKGVSIKMADSARIDKKRGLWWWRKRATIVDGEKKINLSFGGKLRWRPREGWLGLLRQAGFSSARCVTNRAFKEKLYFVAVR